MTTMLAIHPGEELGVPERVIVAPALGVFSAAAPHLTKFGTPIIEEGQVIGMIRSSGDDVPVRSPFRGAVMGMLAVDGERVRDGQPIAWLRIL
jgi:biotin carboxyl carrier protein